MRDARIVVAAALLALATACGGAPEPAARTPTAPAAKPTSEPAPDLTYQAVAVVDARRAFVFGLAEGRPGSVVLQTTDGGDHWAAVLRAPDRDLVSLTFFADRGIAVSDDGVVYRTEDGGATWSASDDAARFVPRSPVDGASVDIQEVVAASPESRFAVGVRESDDGDVRPLLQRTRDGGATWEDASLSPKLPPVVLKRVFFADARTGWIVGGDTDDDDPSGILLTTTDGGATWAQVKSEAQQTPTDVFFLDAKRGWLVGETEDVATGGAGPSKILASDDGGATWRVQASVPTSLRAVRFADAQNGWAIGGASTILHTADGGATWTAQTTQDRAAGQEVRAPASAASNVPKRPMFFSFTPESPDRGWAASDRGVCEYRGN